MRRMYSEEQLGNVALKELQDKDLQVKTILQSEANKKFTFTQFPNIAGCDSEVIFGRIQQINQELHIIMIGKIKNNTDSSISQYSTTSVTIDLTEDIASKIYDMRGKTAHESSGGRISGNLCYCARDDLADASKIVNNVYMYVMNTTTANRISILFQRTSQITIAAGETTYFECRVSLDLL